jgi:hypothetical protein
MNHAEAGLVVPARASLKFLPPSAARRRLFEAWQRLVRIIGIGLGVAVTDLLL